MSKELEIYLLNTGIHHGYPDVDSLRERISDFVNSEVFSTSERTNKWNEIAHNYTVISPVTVGNEFVHFFIHWDMFVTTMVAIPRHLNAIDDMAQYVLWRISAELFPKETLEYPPCIPILNNDWTANVSNQVMPFTTPPITAVADELEIVHWGPLSNECLAQIVGFGEVEERHAFQPFVATEGITAVVVIDYAHRFHWHVSCIGKELRRAALMLTKPQYFTASTFYDYRDASNASVTGAYNCLFKALNGME